MKKYEGDNFEDFLAAEGILEDVTERALKRLLALEIEDMVNAANVSRVGGLRMNKYSGGNFDDFLKEEGIFEEVLESTRKRLLALQIEDRINAVNRRGTAFAEKINADFAQLNHYLFDLDNTVITSELLDELALEATELTIDPVHLNGALFDLEELLDHYFSEKVAA